MTEGQTAVAGTEGEIEEADLQAGIDTYNALVFSGLEITKLREEALRSMGPSRSKALRTFGGIIALGPKFSKRAERAVDVEKARAFVHVLNGLYIMESRTTQTSLTVPRIIMCFAPIFYRLRQAYAERDVVFRTNVSSTTPPWKCEAALSCLSDWDREMIPFLEAFAVVLNQDAKRKNKTNKKESDMEAVAYMHNLRALAVHGFVSDPLYQGVDVMQMTLKQLLVLHGFTED
jgi:hypothetical protein